MRPLETLVLHGSGWLEAADASGVQGEARRPLPLDRLRLQFSRAPADLQCVAQSSGRLALWRRRPEGLRRIVDGAAAPADLVPPAAGAFTLQGRLDDPQGQFLPRSFSLSAGQGGGHRLRVYRSSAGTPFGREGGLVGQVRDAAGRPLAWALLTLRVEPPLAAALDYAAQADAQGEFRLALQRLPAGASADATFPARLGVRAAAAAPGAAPDPDTLPAASIRTGDGADPQWRTELDFDVAPGRVASLTSPGQGALVLQLA